MQADAAVAETVGPHQEATLSAADFHGLLLESSADAKLCRAAWVANMYQWTVWKLAAYEQQWPCLQHKLLTRDVVLDELKAR